tara:strand:- start:8414 stop:8764 length:351 start_codon:yes stop_codon:yes gene_type:complete
MLQVLIKVLITSVIIAFASEIAKKDTFLAGIIVSMPIISILSILWVYIDTKDIDTINSLSNSIFWMVIPSLSLFVSLPLLLKTGINFYVGMFLSILITISSYFLLVLVLNRSGIDI